MFDVIAVGGFREIPVLVMILYEVNSLYRYLKVKSIVQDICLIVRVIIIVLVAMTS